jgi:phosphoglycerate dehydrogenase-like enzyme
MKIVIPDRIDILAADKQVLKDLGAKLYDDVPETTELIERIKDAEIITANYVDITKEVIDGAPNLKYIAVPAVGYEWVDTAYAAERGIRVLNCPTYNSQAVAEHAIALLFVAARNIPAATASLQNGEWNHAMFVGTEVSGKKLAIIGHGNIGKRVESMAQGLGMETGYVDSKTSPEAIDQLLGDCDFVIIAAPLTEQTRHLVDARRLELLKLGAILVNVGRGAIVEQKALLAALDAGKISVGLDVYEGEPLTGKPSEKIVELAKLPNVVATPHMAYNTTGTQARLGPEIIADIRSCLDGQPINVVNWVRTAVSGADSK